MVPVCAELLATVPGQLRQLDTRTTAEVTFCCLPVVRDLGTLNLQLWQAAIHFLNSYAPQESRYCAGHPERYLALHGAQKTLPTSGGLPQVACGRD